MRITLKVGDDYTPLAGTFGQSERQHTSVVDFRMGAAVAKQSGQKVRAGSAGERDRGNLETTISFTTRRMFGSAGEAFRFCADHEAQFPRSGSLMLSTGAGTRHLADAVVSPPVHRIDGCAAVLDYTAHGAGIVQLTAGSSLEEQGEGSGLEWRTVEDGGEKWFEVGFLSPFPLSGDAANGWIDPSGQTFLRFARSEDLVSWDHDFIAAPDTPEDAGGGDWRYWARLKYPVDSEIKTGQLVVTSDPSEDARNAPFTALVINGVAQSLAHFPYTMPGHAAQMQTDLRAVGWTGATVVSSSASVWRIEIPDVDYTTYSSVNYIYWPMYLVPDSYGNIINPVDGRGFSGTFVNALGVRTSLTRQFARLEMSAGPNNPY